MRENIKESILETARQLFEQKGYNGVSIKNISDALGSSTGNLTYYFKRKEDLAEAVVEKQHDSYKRLQPPENLQELYSYLSLIIEVQNKNAYYYKHYAQFSQISSKIKNIQDEVFSDLHNALSSSLEKLYEDGLIISDAIPNQRALIIDTIMLLCVSGQTSREINRLRCMWNALYPLLTEKGKKIYTTIE